MITQPHPIELQGTLAERDALALQLLPVGTHFTCTDGNPGSMVIWDPLNPAVRIWLDESTGGGGPPTGAAGGDLADTYPNPRVARIQGRAVLNAAPSDGDVLLWSAGTTRWEPTALTAADVGAVGIGAAAGGDLANTYPNPSVARIQGRSVLNAAPTDKQVLAWIDGNTRWEPYTLTAADVGAAGLSDDPPADLDDVADPGIGTEAARWDHVHQYPTLEELGAPALSDDTPEPLGPVFAGTSVAASRSDHIHAMPSAFDVGAVDLVASENIGGTKTFTVAINVPTPTTSTSATTKAYVDAIAEGLDVKASVRVATTANLAATRVSNTLTANANGSINTAGIDGVTTLAVGNRVGVKDQTTGADRGLYQITSLGSAGTPWVMVRTSDADTSAEVTTGLFFFVSQGTVNASTGWVLTTPDPITLNTTSLSFTQFSSAGQVTAGAGLTLTGTTLAVGAGTGITVNPDDVAVLYGTTAGTALEGDRDALYAHLASANLFTAAQTVALDDLATSTRSTIATLRHTTGNTAAAGFGTSLAFEGEDAAGTTVALAEVVGVLQTAGAGSVAGAIDIYTRTGGAAAARNFRFEGTGSLLIGANLPAFGGVGLGIPNNVSIAARNAADSAYLLLARLSTSNAAEYGSNSGPTTILGNASGMRFGTTATTTVIITASNISVGLNNSATPGSGAVKAGLAAGTNIGGTTLTTGGGPGTGTGAVSRQDILVSQAVASGTGQHAENVGARFTEPTADTQVALLLRANRAGTLTLDQVTFGATDSGGTGFRVLRIPN